MIVPIWNSLTAIVFNGGGKIAFNIGAISSASSFFTDSLTYGHKVETILFNHSNSWPPAMIRESATVLPCCSNLPLENLPKALWPPLVVGGSPFAKKRSPGNASFFAGSGPVLQQKNISFRLVMKVGSGVTCSMLSITICISWNWNLCDTEQNSCNWHTSVNARAE